MKLFSRKEESFEKFLAREKEKTAKIVSRKERAIAEKELIETEMSIDPEKRKRWIEFCEFNKGIQQRKAKLLLEIEELEKRKERLLMSIDII